MDLVGIVGGGPVLISRGRSGRGWLDATCDNLVTGSQSQEAGGPGIGKRNDGHRVGCTLRRERYQRKDEEVGGSEAGDLRMPEVKARVGGLNQESAGSLRLAFWYNSRK